MSMNKLQHLIKTNFKKTIAVISAILMQFSFVGCKKQPADNSSSEEAVVIYEYQSHVETTEDSPSNNNSLEANNSSSKNSNIDSSIISGNSSSAESSKEENSMSSSNVSQTGINYEWKSHSYDYKLLAFTFDDAPGGNVEKLIELFSAYQGAGTFFVNRKGLTDQSRCNALQKAIEAGWAIGNHGATHMSATKGGANGLATYKELKTEISDFSNTLESKLRNKDGSSYTISLYRPPELATSKEMFQICKEDNLAIIALENDDDSSCL